MGFGHRGNALGPGIQPVEQLIHVQALRPRRPGRTEQVHSRHEFRSRTRESSVFLRSPKSHDFGYVTPSEFIAGEPEQFVKHLVTEKTCIPFAFARRATVR